MRARRYRETVADVAVVHRAEERMGQGVQSHVE
jgi:hypothetical protein